MSYSPLPYPPSVVRPVRGRRLGVALLALLIHAALFIGWQQTRMPVKTDTEGREDGMQWLHLPARAPREDALPVPAPKRRSGSLPPSKRPAQPGPARAARADVLPVAPAGSPAGPSNTGLVTEAPAAPAAAAQNARSILETAVRSAGAIDRALRKESKPLIIAPPDSPTRLWEAPKVEELVNNTGDGARRTRVVTGRGTYCVTERSPVTNVEMIEMHGKIRLTNCPRDETPAKAQVWRTARD